MTNDDAWKVGKEQCMLFQQHALLYLFLLYIENTPVDYPTLMKPVPLPAKYPYPYVGSWVLKGTGQGHPKMTLGLPMLITTEARSKERKR